MCLYVFGHVAFLINGITYVCIHTYICIGLCKYIVGHVAFCDQQHKPSKPMSSGPVVALPAVSQAGSRFEAHAHVAEAALRSEYTTCICI